MSPPVFDGRPLAVPVCGYDERALACVHDLVRDLGCEPVAGGGFDRAELLEATAALFIGLWVGEGADAQAIAPPPAMPPDRHTRQKVPRSLSARSS
jgi:predicted dinucleotide-binding enzyme